MTTSMYRMDKYQSPTLEHRELYSIPCDKQDNGNKYEKEYIQLNHSAV